MLQHVGVVGDGQQGVDRHRHDAGVQRTEKRDRKVDAVVQHHQHALFAPHAEAQQAGREAPNALVELAVEQRRRIVDVGELVGALSIQREQVPRRVETLRGWTHGCRHALLLAVDVSAATGKLRIRGP